MPNLSGKIEVIANCCVIIVAILLSIFLVKHLRKPPETIVQANNNSIAQRNDPTGKKLTLPDIDWGQNESTLVLAIQSQCHFCTESASFYKQLVATQATRSKRQLIVVSPEPLEITKKYLDALGVSITNIKQTDFQSLGIAGTPTLLLVDKDGLITKSWRGRLNRERESDVLAHF